MMLAQNLQEIQNQAGINAPKDIGTLIQNILPYIYGIVGMLLLVYLILGGLQIMTSRGDPKAVSAAQAKITSAIIGFVIVFISAILVRIIGQILGIGVFGQIFK